MNCRLEGASDSWAMPAERLNLMIGGFQLNTTTNWSSGLPWSASYNECNSDQDVGICRPTLDRESQDWRRALRSRQPDWKSQCSLLHSGGPLATNGDTQGPFQRPQARNSAADAMPFYGPSFFNSDMSLFKNFAITERFGAQFRFEAFNVFNHVNLGQPNNCIDCGGSEISPA